MRETSAADQLTFQAGLLDAVEQAVIVTDLDSRIIYWNHFAESLYGWASGEAVGRNIGELLVPQASMADAREIVSRLREGLSWSGEFIVQRRDGTSFTCLGTDSPLRDARGVLVGVIGISIDITARKEAEEERVRLAAMVQSTEDAIILDLAYQAQHDGLTGLPNRGLLHARLQHALESARTQAPRGALLLLDLDRFREVNDTLGHQVGDVLLQQIGRRLQGVVRPADLVARLGGDEFAVLLLDTDAAAATSLADVLAEALQAPFELDGQPIAVDASIGIAVAPEHGLDADTLLRCADVAMYQAKHSGSGVAVYSADDDDHTPNRLALLGELRTGLERGELLLHYQPKLDLRNGRLVGVEALVRWQHPQHGFMPPGDFIPLAEQSGLIYPLSRWVLDAAIQQHRLWSAEGIDVPVAVNLSRRMLHEPHLAEAIAVMLAHWDVPPGALILEITESSLMADLAGVKANLDGLRALGVRMAIDDFGTGYSSLASLKNLSVDELKIDASFVQAMATDASARAIVRAIIELADALELQVVAEGVEDRATWDVLAGLGCDVAQGYFLSPPIAADELEQWAARMGPSWLKIAAPSRAEDPLHERIRARGARLTAEEEFIARKQTEAALHASEERNRLALQAAGMGTWDVDVVAGIHTWSSETEALFGLAPGAFQSSLAIFTARVHPDDWPILNTAWHRAVAERRDFSASYRTIWQDGSTHWIEDKGRGQYDSNGDLLRIIGTSMDITQRKEAEAALLASEERFRKQYKGFPLPTFSWLQVGDDFVLQDFNDAAETTTEGHINEDVGGRASIMYAEQPQILTDLRECLTQQRTLRREIRYRYQSLPLERDLAVSYVFVPPSTVMVHTEDITDVKRALEQREAMAQSEKLRAVGQMATGIAHDLNQSLMLVASYSGLARQALVADPPDLAEIEDLLTTTTQAALDGGDTVKRLLLFTRAEPKQEGTLVDLSRLVRDAGQLTAPRWRDAAQAAGRPITLQVEAVGHPTIRGSPARLRELMTNLIFNAVDALPNGGSIRLRVLVDNDLGVVEVIDSGVGMSAEVQERVFEPFFTTKGVSGTGLGLAMVFGIVEQHGGHIEVRSAVGEGTMFRITLPVVEAAALAGPAPAVQAAPETQEPLRVLVVDDEPMMTRAVMRMLRPSGHTVHVAASGEEALLKLGEQPFDVVVSDMGMGAGMNGWELADAVRQRWPRVRFLLATGWGASIDPREAKSRGVEAVLSKPYRLIDLVEALGRSDAAA